jgi:cell wall-associated NlpC family hydrolase
MIRTLKLTSAALAAAAATALTASSAFAATSAYQAPGGLHAASTAPGTVAVGWKPEAGPGFKVTALTGAGRTAASLVTRADTAAISHLAPGRYTIRVAVNAPGAPYSQVTALTAAAAPAAAQLTAPATAQLTAAATAVTVFNAKAAAYAKTLEGIPYLYGGTTPKGFDCSGLTQYVYAHFGKAIQRTADAQFRQFRRESLAAAQPGDLVFFHDTSNLSSTVYHVGIYEGGTMMVAAPHTGAKVQLQSFTWGGSTLSFGTITH